MLTTNTGCIGIFFYFSSPRIWLSVSMFVRYWLLLNDQPLVTFKYHFLRSYKGNNLGDLYFCISCFEYTVFCFQGIAESVSNRCERLGLDLWPWERYLATLVFSFPVLQRKHLGQMVFQITPSSHMMLSIHHCSFINIESRGGMREVVKKLSGHHTRPKPTALDRSSRCGSRLSTVLWLKTFLTQALSPFLFTSPVAMQPSLSYTFQAVMLLQSFCSHLCINFHFLRWKTELTLLRKLA